jgi:Tol biopolymer transport system component
MIRYTHQADEVIFAARQHRQAPYLLYRLNLRSQQLQELNQPQALNAGNSQFDLHPTEQKILISSPDQQQWEGFYQLDLTNNQLTLLFKQNAYVCCGIWSHDGRHVVLTGEHPATELVAYHLNGQQHHIIYAGPQQISWPQRHPNGRDYLFTGQQQNSQLQWVNQGQVTPLFRHSSHDQLGRFAPDGQSIALISQRSGREQVWITDTNTRQPRQLTQWPDHRHILDLVWSPDGRQLAALTLNQIHLIQRSNGDSQQLVLAETSIRGLSFKDANTLAFSLPSVQGWQLYYYDLPSQQLQKADERWAFARFSPKVADTIWQDHARQLFTGAAAAPVMAPPIKAASLLDGRQFNLTKQGDVWYWQQMQQGYSLFRFEQKTQQSSLITTSNMAGFDVFDAQLLHSDSQHFQANIYSTDFSETP